MQIISAGTAKSVAGGAVTINEGYTYDELLAIHKGASAEAKLFGWVSGLGTAYVTQTVVSTAVGLTAAAALPYSVGAGVLTGLCAYNKAYYSYELWPWNLYG